MAGRDMTSRLEKKDSTIASLRERITKLQAEKKELRAARRTSAKANASAGGRTTRPRTSKGRTRAGARSARSRKSVAPAAAA